MNIKEFQDQLNSISDSCIARICVLIEDGGEPRKVLPLITQEASMDKIEKMVEAIRGMYKMEGNAAGGYGHIVFDDGNIEDNNIEFCLDECEKGEDDYIPESSRLKCIEVLKMFKELSIDERIEVIDQY